MRNGVRRRAHLRIRGFTPLVSLLAMAIVMSWPAPRVEASSQDQVTASDTSGAFCSGTAEAAFRACGLEARDDFNIAFGICINVSNDAERAECFADARASREESRQLCDEQLTARRNVCGLLGEGRYDPNFDPALFEDDFANLANPNRYFPLTIGNQWEYSSGTESNTVTVLNRTKLIEGVTCIVVRDRVTDEGELIENTDDWFAQKKNGSVFYCGEEAKSYETFEGDDPMNPELVSIEGSFKAGRDGDKPGAIFKGSPTVGDVYRQEFSLGNAEDIAKVLSTSYSFGKDANLDKSVPRRLAELLCSDDCVVTRDTTPLEPGVVERKYYAPGIGMFLETNPDTGEMVQLVSCNFDSRCDSLPSPK